MIPPAQNIHPDWRQEILNGAYRISVDTFLARGWNMERLTRAVESMTDTFLELGFAPDEIRKAAAQRWR